MSLYPCPDCDGFLYRTGSWMQCDNPMCDYAIPVSEFDWDDVDDDTQPIAVMSDDADLESQYEERYISDLDGD